MFADLHLHSTSSDGCFTPAQVVHLAKESGLSAIAVTDHDTVSGIKEGLAAGARLGIEVIPAVELSSLNDGGEIHILGYYVNWKDPNLEELLRSIRAGRVERARLMVEKLGRIGVNIPFSLVMKYARGDYVGRPHIARAMVEAGCIESMAEAFSDRYIGNDGPAYVERAEMDSFEALEVILRFGGVPVLAHPGFFRRGEGVPKGTIRALAKKGLAGLECYSSKHSPEECERYLELARELGLLVTGGSDWHGDEEHAPDGAPASNPRHHLLGSVMLPYHHVKLLKERAARAG